MSNANDPARWNWHQLNWDTARPVIEHTREAGWLTLYAEAADDDGDRDIHAVTTDDDVYVGTVFVGPSPQWRGRLEGAPEVRPGFRRRGVCTALYDWSEELYGLPMAPAWKHSEDAAAFWAGRRV